MDTKLNPKTLKTYLDNLPVIGVPSAVIKRKIASIQRFISWAQDKQIITTEEYNNLTAILITHKIPKISILRTLINNLRRLIPESWKHLPEDALPSQTPLYYAGITMMFIIMAILGAGIYSQLFKQKVTSSFAYPVTPTRGTRILSFQGRLTDTLSNPITTTTDVTFKLYNVSSGGSPLYTGACTGGSGVDPDNDGIFNTLIGSDCGMSEIPATVFTENANVYMGITVGSDSEMTPRQQIANVGYALNAETLQGLPVGKNTSMIPYINDQGDVLIAASAPGLRSTYASATFSISSANAITLASAGSGDIILNASESGTLKFQTGGTDRITVVNNGNIGIGNVTNPSTFNLQIAGHVGPNATDTYDLGSVSREWRNIYGQTLYANGVAVCDANGNNCPSGAGGWTDGGTNVYLTTDTDRVGIGTTNPVSKLHLTGKVTGKALAIFDENGDQALFTASASGITKFLIDHAGNVGIGMTNPAANLDIKSSSANNDVLKLIASDGSRLGRFTETAGGAGWFEVDDASGNPQALFRGDSSASYILSGNFGLGTSSPLEVLDVRGNASVSGNVVLAGSSRALQSTNFNPLTIGGSTTGSILLNPNNGAAGGLVAPTTTNVTDLGNSAQQFRNIYGQTLYANGVAVCDANGNNCPSSSGAWTYSAPYVYPTATATRLGLGTTTTSNIISQIYVTRNLADGALGKALSIFNQTENQDILTASASGTPRLTVLNDGTLQFHQASSITTTTGNLTLNSTGGTTTVSDNLVVTGTSDLQGAVSNSTGNLVLDDTVDIGSSANGLRVDTAGNVIDINGNIVLNDTTDIGSASTGVNVTTAGALSDTDGNLLLNDTVDLGSASTGLNVTTTGTLSDIDGNLVLNDTTDIGSASTGLNVTTAGLITDIDGNVVIGDIVDLGSATTGINITTAGVISDTDGNLSLNDNTDITGNLTLTGTLSDSNSDVQVNDNIDPNTDATFDLGDTTTSWRDMYLTGQICFDDTDCFSASPSNTTGWTDDGTVVRLTTATDQVGIGTATPTSRIHVVGKVTGKALAIFDETGDQALLTASASGVTKFTVSNGGDITFAGTTGLSGTGSGAGLNFSGSGTHTIQASAGALTINAFTLGGTITGGNNNISAIGNITANSSSNTITGFGTIGTNGTTAFTGSTLNVTGQITSTLSTGTAPMVIASTTKVTNLNADLLDGIDSSGFCQTGGTGCPTGLYVDLQASTPGTQQTGNINVSGAILGGYFADTSNTNYGIDPAGTSNFGGYSLKVTGGSLLAVDSGSVGVGIGTPVGKLHVNGAITGKALAMFNETGDQALLTASASGVTKFLVDHNGNVGIGTTNTTHHLTVKGTTTVVGSNIANTLTGALNVAASILDRGDQANGYALNYYYSGGAEVWQMGLRANDNKLHLRYTDSIEAATFDTIGSLGLGTTGPVGKLHVTGKITGKALAIFDETGDQNLLVASASGVTKFTIDHNGNVGIGSTNNAGKLTLLQQGSTSTDGLYLTNSLGNSGRGYLDSSSNLRLQTGTNNSQLVLHNGGNVGIGTTTPQALLAVGSTSQFQVNSSGNLTSINNVTYSWPGSQGAASTVLTNNGSGTLTWTSVGTLTGTGSSGQVTFWNGTTTQTGDNAFFWDNTNKLLGIGTNTPVSKLELTGAVKGKALAIFNETGDQDVFVASASGSPVFTIKHSGNVGIGTTAPTAKLEIGGVTSTISNTSGNITITPATNLYVSSGNLGIGTSSPGAKIGVPAATAATGGIDFGGDVNLYRSAANVLKTDDALNVNANFNVTTGGVVTVNLNGGVAVNAMCHTGTDVDASTNTNRDLVPCNPGTLTDYAEYYPTENSADYGEIMATSNDLIEVNAGDGYGQIDPNRYFKISKLKKSTSAYQNNIIGITSLNFGEISALGEHVVPQEHHPMPIALNGRVPVKVTSENGDIKPGDLITPSSRPGIGMKATKPGMTVGKALGSYSNTDKNHIGQVMVFVGISWYDPALLVNNDGNIAMNGRPVNIGGNTTETNSQLNNVGYKAISSDGSIVQTIDTFAKITSATVMAGLIQTQDAIVKQILSATAIIADSIKTVTLETEQFTTGSLEALSAYIPSLTATTITVEDSVISPLVKTESLQVTGNAAVKTVQTSEIKPADTSLVIDLSGNISPTPTPEGSGKLAQLIIKGLEGKTVATIDNSGNATFSGTISATDVQAKDASVSGQIVAGTVVTDSFGAKEASIAGTVTAKEIQADTIRGSQINTIESNISKNDQAVKELSGNVNDIQKLLAELKDQPLPNANYYQNLNQPVPASASGQIHSSGVEAIYEKLSVTGFTILADAYVTNTFAAGDVQIQGDSVISLASELKLSALNNINLFDGAVTIARNGSITTVGEVIAQGGVRTNDIKPAREGEDIHVTLSKTVGTAEQSLLATAATPKLKIQDGTGKEVASIDASGSARFKDIALDQYLEATASSVVVSAQNNYTQNGLYAPAITTNGKTIGVGTLPGNSNVVAIYNEKISDTSLIYVTPTSPTDNKTLYIAEKVSCKDSLQTQGALPCRPHFIVAISGTVPHDIQFNWWIIN